MKKSPSRGITLIEIGVVLGILALLLAIAVPGYMRYRAHQTVNRALEIAEGLTSRAKEEARSSGFALTTSLRETGLTQAALSGRQSPQGPLALRIRKRFRASEVPKVVSLRELSGGVALDYELFQLGTLDLDAEANLEGVFLELLDNGAPIAVIPVDVNGEFYLLGEKNSGFLRFHYGDYNRTLELTRRGASRPDRR